MFPARPDTAVTFNNHHRFRPAIIRSEFPILEKPELRLRFGNPVDLAQRGKQIHRHDSPNRLNGRGFDFPASVKSSGVFGLSRNRSPFLQAQGNP